MITFRALLSDLENEAKALEVLLTRIDEEVWLRPTPAAGWDVRDSVAHLATGDDLAHSCVVEGKAELMDEGMAAAAKGPGSARSFEQRLLEKGRSLPPNEVLDWWRSSNRRLVDALGGLDPKARLAWGPSTMSAPSFVTARLMETWAHGLDCFDAAGCEPVDTDRLRHVAHLGLRALPYAFAQAGLPRPGEVRLELVSPSGVIWSMGPDDAPTTVSGSASDWCRRAVRRDRHNELDRLTASGPDGEAVLTHVRAYL